VTQLPVDDLRERLKELGYLGTGVDRFVLAPARQDRSPAWIAAGASVRVGLLAAALLGPAAAIGIAARLPELVTGVRDAIVVAIYLGLLFGIGGAAVALLAALLARNAILLSRDAARPRIGRLAPAAAGFVVTAACLAYLTLWWGAINPGPAWRAPIWTAVALTAALSISLVIGHAVAVTVGAVLARESPAPRATTTARRTGRAPFLVRIVAFGAAAALLVATARPARTSDAAPAPAFAVVPTGQRVVVIGIDGFDPGLVGVPPRGFSNWAVSTAIADVPGAQDSDPARVWTTIATGVPAERHGISALELRRVAGLEGAVAPGASRTATAVAAATDLMRLARPAVASGSGRKVKTFWEVAAEKGLSTAAVNWWATWPASGPSTVLSDRALLRLEHTGGLDAEIWPAELYSRLRPDWSKLSSQARQLASEGFERIVQEELRSVLLRSAELDATIALLATHPAIEGKDLLALYLPGLDIAQHTLATADLTPTASALAARTDGIRAYYAFLGNLIDRVAPRNRALLMVVTHPGRVSSAARGAIAVAGWTAARSTRVEAAFVDVAPTVLFALGIPAARDLSGTPLTALFNERFVERYPARTVGTYGQRTVAAPTRGGQPLDQEMLDRLRSLGYVR
jgi:Type I phosphodiesterase / nucleotide pyrophosphatase